MSTFSDVKSSDWYSDAVKTAQAYGLISGFGDGSFRPMEKITREQAMSIISKAMVITALKDQLPAVEISELLNNYTDANIIADWAAAGVADCVQSGIVSGRSSTVLVPKDCITRAEVAVIVEKLLRKSELI